MVTKNEWCWHMTVKEYMYNTLKCWWMLKLKRNLHHMRQNYHFLLVLTHRSFPSTRPGFGLNRFYSGCYNFAQHYFPHFASLLTTGFHDQFSRCNSPETFQEDEFCSASFLGRLIPSMICKLRSHWAWNVQLITTLRQKMEEMVNYLLSWFSTNVWISSSWPWRQMTPHSSLALRTSLISIRLTFLKLFC